MCRPLRTGYEKAGPLRLRRLLTLNAGWSDRRMGSARAGPGRRGFPGTFGVGAGYSGSSAPTPDSGQSPVIMREITAISCMITAGNYR
jgi:hypothetical protein